MVIHRALAVIPPLARSRLCMAAAQPSAGTYIATRQYNGGKGEAGAGVGRGGGGGGSVREAGGAFGRLEVAREEEYFRRLQRQQIKDLKDEVDREIRYHEQQLKHHQEALDRMSKRRQELQKEQDSL